jgi:type I restriction enzyme M protein
MMHLSTILKDSNYGLSQFTQAEIQALEQTIFIKENRGKQVPYILCLIRQKHIQLKPEEIVRQLFLLRLMKQYDYPIERIGVEVPVAFGSQTKRADIVVFDKDRPTVPYIIVELKKPKRKDGKEQLRSYCNATGAPIGIWTNGTDPIEAYHRKEPNYFDKLTHIPNAYQTLKDLLEEDFTIDDLIKEDELNQGKKTLKDVIEEMEDEVLANAGVDVFEESFKLIFTKLYDEFTSANSRQRPLQFRVGVDTEAEIYAKIQKLFEKAQEKWEGVFQPDAEIELSVSHLPTCISYLQKYKLFNSNLDVIDEAFEYLINKTAKGEKGQYFTPRYVIDLCVKMLNPKPDETVIDTAAGSSGFTVHSIFHVWKQLLQQEGKDETHLFTAENKPSHYIDYVRQKVFAIDFDEKAVRVARCLNLIAGDGQTNVLHLNSLDWERWKETTGQWKWIDKYNDGFKRLRKLTVDKKGENFRDFTFDVLMANPPFAGDIKDQRLITKYELGKKADSRALTQSKKKSAKNKGWQEKISRHILFIERNLHFLKPGGRMAIVLPQGVFNNSSDYYIRDFIAKQCRILAVVGLHPNTFKPHTGTKTSVLFVQKWNDEPKAGALCPYREDYPIFFATQQSMGKNNSGDKIFARDAETGELLLDKHGHYFVEHDLFSTELKNGSKTADGIAEAFIEFASKEGLSFFLHSAFNEVKYRALLDGLDVTEVNLSEALENKDFRIDSEFHKKPPFVENPQLTYVEIGSILQKAQYGLSIEMNEEKVGYKIYRMNEIVNMLCSFEVNKWANVTESEMNDFRLQEGDVLFNRTNSQVFVGRTGLFKAFSRDEYIFASYLIRLIPDKKYVLPEYLTVFLNSKLGIWDIKRRARISINQSNVNAEEVKSVKIPLLSMKFQCKIVDLFDSAFEKLFQSKTLYTQAESLLLQELGLDNWQPPTENVAIKNFSASFGATGRLDAEYYQPKYDKLLGKINQNATYVKQIKDIQTFNMRGLQPKYVENGEIKVINSKHLKEQNLDYDNFETTDAVAYSEQERASVLKNDILTYTTGANVGRTNIYLRTDKALASNHVNILRIKDEKPLYVAFVMNSLVGRIQTERLVTGSAQVELYPKDIECFIIPFVNVTIQNKITTQLKTSFALKDESKLLLESAKHAVELAIDQGEKQAMAWLTINYLKMR